MNQTQVVFMVLGGVWLLAMAATWLALRESKRRASEVPQHDDLGRELPQGAPFRVTTGFLRVDQLRELRRLQVAFPEADVFVNAPVRLVLFSEKTGRKIAPVLRDAVFDFLVCDRLGRPMCAIDLALGPQPDAAYQAKALACESAGLARFVTTSIDAMSIEDIRRRFSGVVTQHGAANEP